MRIPCPFCGKRDLVEFTHEGDASVKRPALDETDQAVWNAHVYDRENPAGTHREYWLHSGGCRQLLVVERSTLTHDITSVTTAREAK